MFKSLRYSLFLFLIAAFTVSYAQVPVISYTSPHTYFKGAAITSLVPTSSGVAAPGSVAGAVTVGTGFDDMKTMGVDHAGNGYVVANGSSEIQEFPATGGSPLTDVSVGCGCITPTSIAVDAAGNVYVVDSYDNALKEIPVGNGPVVTLVSGFNSPYGLAIDATGNLYVGDSNNNEVEKIPAGTTTKTVIASGLNHPMGVAVDAAGNVYEADRGSNTIKEIPVNGGSVITLASGDGNANSVAVDPAGNVYFADTDDTSIKEIPVGGGSVISVGSGFATPNGVAIDGAGNLFIADEGNNAVKKLPPGGGYFIYPALPAGLSIDNATGIISGTPTATSPATNYTVVAYNSSGGSSAVVNITVTDALLSSIALSPVSPLTTVTGPGYANYTASVANGVTSIAVIPTVRISTVTVTVNGVAVASGTSSASIPLAVGANTITTIATAQGGGTTQDYIITVGRGASVTTLSNLQLSSGTLTSTGANSYTASVTNATSAVTLTPTTTDPNAKITVAINGGAAAPVTSGTASASLPLSIGANTITAIVTAQDGVTTATYTITVTRYKPAIATLSNIKLTPASTLTNTGTSGTTTTYTTSVSAATASLTLTPTATDPAATITVNGVPVASGAASGSIALAFGSSTITTVVTAQDGTTTQTYSIVVTRAAGSAIATLSAIKLTPASTLTNTGTTGITTTYTTTVGAGTASVTVTPTATDATATIKVNGVPVTSGAASASIALVAGSNAITTVVTAQDGTTTHIYSIIVTGAATSKPVFSYATPQVYGAGTFIPPLAPINTGGTVGTQTLVTGLNNPIGVAVDAAGNVYVAENGAGDVKEFPTAGGSPLIIASGLKPGALAVDAAGNVYVTDGSQVKEITKSNGAPLILGSGFSGPSGIALDAAGNIYVSDGSSIKKMPPGGGTPVVIASGIPLEGSSGLAVDASGNVYVADPFNLSIDEIPAGSSTFIILTRAEGPDGVAVDASGNVYYSVGVEEYGSIGEIPAGGGSGLQIGSGLTDPQGLAINGSHTIFVTDNLSIKQINPGGYSISPALPAGLSIDSSTGIISGEPTAGCPATNFTVTASNPAGSSTATINITVIDNADLSSLAISSGTLSPAFAPDTTSYTASVTSANSFITLTAVTNDPFAFVQVQVNGLELDSYNGSATSFFLVPGPNNITILVTASDGTTTKTYSLIVTYARSAIATLNAIKLTPASALTNTGTTGTTTTYTTSVGAGTASVTVTPTATDAINATITVNGVAVTSGAASGSIALAVGANTITTVVTAQNGVTTQTYKIIVGRGANNVYLNHLAVSSGTLKPVTGSPNYTDAVTNATTSVTVTPTTTDPNATVTVNGTAVTSGTASAAIPLIVGANTITILVTAQDGITTQPYVITVTRAKSSNALLSALHISAGTLSPVSGSPNYTASVPSATTTVTATTADPNATLTINGTTVPSGTASSAIPLTIGSNTITIMVTAQDGVTTQSYIITVTRLSNVPYLSHISISSGTLTPVSGTPNYTVNVANTVTSVTVTPTTTDPNATVKVNGTSVASGTASAAIPLNVGANAINIVVTAQDGVTTQPYVIAVTRAPSSNAYLSHLAISSGTLKPVTGSPNYTVSVTGSTTSVKVTATTVDPTATLTINGAAVASGTASAAIPLNVGTNAINIVVTAQDGTTTQPYVITVTRPSNNAYLSHISISSGTLKPVTGSPNYTDAVTNATTSVTVTPTTTDPNATVTVNGTAVISGTASAAIPLNVGANTINIVVTAQDGTTMQPYVITVTRAPSSNAYLSHLAISSGTLTPVTGSPNYTVSETNATKSVTVTATTADPTATLKINGTSVMSGIPSAAIALVVGSNTINIVVTAQDGVTTQPYVITVTRATGPLMSLYSPISVVQPADNVPIENDGVMVHQGVSPNGDGINDFLTIDGIIAYPDNTLQIIDRNGRLIYQAKGYNNISNVFDGHSGINGRMQQPGTYFYSLDYVANGQNRHRTGFILLKY